MLRKLVRRLKKKEAVPIVEVLLKTLNNFDIIILILQKHDGDAISRARLRKSGTVLSKGDDISRARLRKLDTVLNSPLTDKSSSRARLNKTKADDLPNIDNSDVSSS